MENSENQAFAHLVYFTLQEKTAEMQDRLVAGCHHYLSDHAGTLHFSTGGRATAYQREVNDQEFDVALMVVFASEADHEQYQVSERHQQFLAEYKQLWSQVRVFDALV